MNNAPAPLNGYIPFYGTIGVAQIDEVVRLFRQGLEVQFGVEPDRLASEVRIQIGGEHPSPPTPPRSVSDMSDHIAFFNTKAEAEAFQHVRGGTIQELPTSDTESDWAVVPHTIDTTDKLETEIDHWTHRLNRSTN